MPIATHETMLPASQLILAAPSPSLATGAMPFPLDPALLPAGVLLITGAFMLLAGRRLLRAGLGITGALVGALLGNAIGMAASMSVLPPVICSALGALLGLGLGLLLWRFTVASIMAGSCAALAVLMVLFAVQSGLVAPMPVTPDETQLAGTPDQLSMLQTIPTGSFDPPPPRSLEDTIARAAAERAQEHASHWWTGAIEQANAAASSWLDAVNERLASTFAHLWSSWERLDSGLRAALGGVALLGGLFGFLFGLVAGKWSGSIVAVVVGAGLVLLGGLIALGILLPSPEGVFGGMHPAFWLAGWAILACAGSVIQWHAERRRADIEGTVETE